MPNSCVLFLCFSFSIGCIFPVLTAVTFFRFGLLLLLLLLSLLPRRYPYDHTVVCPQVWCHVDRSAAADLHQLFNLCNRCEYAIACLGTLTKGKASADRILAIHASIET